MNVQDTVLAEQLLLLVMIVATIATIMIVIHQGMIIALTGLLIGMTHTGKVHIELCVLNR